jgi:hypothetical protein
MRTITEVLIEAEDIINYNMETLHKLLELSNTVSKDNPMEQAALAKSMACIWNYLKPVHRWIRDQNPKQETFYAELDKYLEESEKRSSEVKPMLVPEQSKKKGKK